MDNLTHSLVGLMMARVFFSNIAHNAAGRDHSPSSASATRAVRSSKNAWMMVVAANLPDIDIVSWAGGPLTYIEVHRGFAHSLLAAPVLAAAAMVLFRNRGWQAYLACLAGVLSHLMLDWTNTYGIRMLLPFSNRWLHLDSTDVVDPWIWLAFLLAIAAPALAGLVSSEIGARKNSWAMLGWAWFALIFLCAYDGTRFAAHQRAIAVMSARLYNGLEPSRIAAIPSRWSPFEWRGVVEADDFVDDVPVNLNAEFDPSAGRIFYASPPNQPAMQTRPFQVFSKFDQLPFWKVDSEKAQLIDLRFGTPEHPGFTATAILGPSGEVTESKFGFGPLPVLKHD